MAKKDKERMFAVLIAVGASLVTVGLIPVISQSLLIPVLVGIIVFLIGSAVRKAVVNK